MSACWFVLLFAGISTILPDVAVAAGRTACLPDEKRHPGSSQILIVSGRTEDVGEWPGRLRHALEKKNIEPPPIHLKIVDEDDASAIAGQLDPAAINRYGAVVTLSGVIAQTLSASNLGPPTVFATIIDPVSWKIVDSYGPRRTNATGITYLVDLEAKYLELLKLAFPQVRRVGILADGWFFDRPAVKELIARSGTLGVTPVPFVARSSAELEAVFASPASNQVDAWIVPETPVVFRHEARVLELLESRHVPNMFGHPSMLKKGALLTYGVEFSSMWDEIAQMLRLICSGVPAREIPVVRPHRVFFGVSATNLRRRGFDVDPRIYRVATFVH